MTSPLCSPNALRMESSNFRISMFLSWRSSCSDFALLAVELGERVGVLRVRDRGNQTTLLRRQAVPPRLVDCSGQHSAGLMEAGVVVELGRFVQAEVHVVPRPNPFAGIDRP